MPATNKASHEWSTRDGHPRVEEVVPQVGITQTMEEFNQAITAEGISEPQRMNTRDQMG